MFIGLAISNCKSLVPNCKFVRYFIEVTKFNDDFSVTSTIKSVTISKTVAERIRQGEGVEAT